jgi:hypothetical protein
MPTIQQVKLSFVTGTLLLLLAQPALPGCGALPMAAADMAETLVQPILIDVLANDIEPSGQAMTIEVVGETCPGTVAVDFGLLRFTPSGILLANCTISYRVRNEEGEISSTALVNVTNINVVVFADGFESGDADAWDTCDPACP